MRTTKISSCLAVALIAVCFMGAKACDTATTAYGASGKAALDIAQTIHTAADTVDQLRRTGSLTTAEEKEALRAMDAITSLNNDFISCTRLAHTEGASAPVYVQCAQNFLGTMNDPAFMAAMRVSNTESQQKVGTLFVTVESLLSSTLAQLNSLK